MTEPAHQFTMKDAIRYEVGAAWWTKHIGWRWLQGLAGAYFNWKVKRKWLRFVASQKSIRATD